MQLKFFLGSSLSVRALNTSQLQALGIEMMPHYKDPYSGRVLTRGEIGCFLSHHSIWTQVRVERCSNKVCELSFNRKPPHSRLAFALQKSIVIHYYQQRTNMTQIHVKERGNLNRDDHRWVIFIVIFNLFVFPPTGVGARPRQSSCFRGRCEV